MVAAVRRTVETSSHSDCKTQNREALEGRRQTLDDRHPSTFAIINNIAGLRQAQGQLADAEAIHPDAVEG